MPACFLVYLVKASACDPKELAEASGGRRQVALDPIVSQAGLLPVQQAFGLATGSVLFVLKTHSVGGGLGAPLSCVGRPDIGSLK
jgi:hypothetical protein